MTYWTNCLKRFREYAYATVPDVLVAPNVYKYEFYLHLPLRHAISNDSQAKSKTVHAFYDIIKIIRDPYANTRITHDP